MRKTIGKYVRRYLYDKRLGDRRVVAIYRDGVKIWPTLSDTVYSCVLDVAAVEGALDWAYWLHAVDALAKLGASAECYMKLTAGGREYMLGSTFGGWYLAEFDGRATVVFGDHGPLATKLRVGDEVTVRMRVPERESARCSVEGESVTECYEALPWLPGCRIGFTVSKGRKKTNAHWGFSVVGADSGVSHVDGYGLIEGHGRGDWGMAVWAKEMQVNAGKVERWQDEYEAGDRGVAVRWVSYNGGTTLSDCRLVWPRFDKVIKLRVAAVTLHE